MIVDMVRGDILKTPHKHIVFAVNAEGFNDAGFAGVVTQRYWKALANTGGNKLGETLSMSTKDRTFHALVCHALAGSGWSKTPSLVEQCLNKLDAPDAETVGAVLMGSGMIGQMGGADTYAILGGIARSSKRVAVYTL